MCNALVVHLGGVCCECHSDLSEQKLPHGPKAKKVDCAKCHATGHNGAPQVAALIKAYKDSIHGHAALEKHVKEAPTCVSCHGTHDIFPKKDKRSKVHHANVPLTCGRCHSDQKLVDKFDIPKGQALKYFERSVHGQLLSQGNLRAAVCTDCHGAHDVLPSSDPRSWVHPLNIPKTCGKCHAGASANFALGKVHVEATFRHDFPGHDCSCQRTLSPSPPTPLPRCGRGGKGRRD